MGNNNKFLWIVLAIGLVSIAFLSSCSPEKSGLSSAISSPAVEAIPVAEVTDKPISDYRLVVDGLVDKPLSLTYEEILRYPAITENLWLVCPGFFQRQNDWTGVPIAIILYEAGIKPEATKILFTASDGYSQELAVSQAQKEGVFLAYLSDGQVLSQSDGYPLRLVVKNQIGAVWVQRLTHIEVK